METRARYVLIGLFTLAVIGAGFVFVYWLQNTGGLAQRTLYRVHFESSVSGLQPGSTVMFNGIRVGEVVAVDLDPADPKAVVATIAVTPNTPVRTDTHVGMDYRGLTGAPTVALEGGTPSGPVPQSTDGAPPLLTADTASSQDLTTAARTALNDFDQILQDNAEPLKTTIANVKTFSDALARNSDKVDGIMAGLEGLTGGGKPKEPPATIDLTAPTKFPPANTQPTAQIAVSEPTTVVALNSQRIMIDTDKGLIPGFEGVQWADAIPLLVQARVIQGFENEGYKFIGRYDNMPAPDNQLVIDIRDFRITKAPDSLARVSFGVRVLSGDGAVVDQKVFTATAPVDGTDVHAAAGALNTAFNKVATELIVWVLGVVA